MAIYAISDVDGDLSSLNLLLEKIRFDVHDTLWFTGNVVNKGEESLGVLRFIKSLAKQAVLVLGYQEVRLLAIIAGLLESTADDSWDDILQAEDCQQLYKWLSQRPFLHHEKGFTLVHAGIPAEWSLSQARTFAIEGEASLAMGNANAFLANIIGDDPTRWHAKHRGWKRLRFIVNALTRISYCNDIGRCNFTAQGEPGSQPKGYIPWYQMPERAMAGHKIICGHSRVFHGEQLPPDLWALSNDSGASLTAMRVTDEIETYSVSRVSPRSAAV